MQDESNECSDDSFSLQNLQLLIFPPDCMLTLWSCRLCWFPHWAVIVSQLREKRVNSRNQALQVAHVQSQFLQPADPLKWDRSHLCKAKGQPVPCHFFLLIKEQVPSPHFSGTGNKNVPWKWWCPSAQLGINTMAVMVTWRVLVFCHLTGVTAPEMPCIASLKITCILALVPLSLDIILIQSVGCW